MNHVSPRGRIARTRLAAAAVVASAVAATGLGIVTASPASAVTTSLTDVEINEVESNGDTTNGDWIELYNTGTDVGDDVNLSGVILSDDDNTHRFVIPSGTTLPVEEWIAFRVDDPAVSGSFGLGSADSARLFPAGTTNLGSVSPTDSYSWTAHAATTYGANPDGSSTFAETAAGTYGSENNFTFGSIRSIAGVKINEVESNADATNGDWVELYNTTGAAINIDGAIITDSDPAHQFVVPDVAPLAAGGYAAFRVDNPAVTGNFGLGSADSAKLYAPGDVTLATVVDEYSWTAHATNTWGRTIAGTGAFAQTASGTFAAVNNFTTGAAVDLAGVVINEVESHGDDVNGDWVELKNTTASAVNLDNAILSDNDNGHSFRIPTSTPDLAAGAVVAFRVDFTGAGSFGFGDVDSVRLFESDTLDLASPGTGNLDATRSWTTHPLQTWGLNSSNAWVATNLGTFGTANDFTSSPAANLSNVVLNEVMTSGDTTNGDWVELLNTTGSTLTIGNMVLKDLGGNVYTIPAGTTLASGAVYTRTAAQLGFAFDRNDGVALYRTAASTIAIDHHEWEAHPVDPANPTDTTVSYARQGSGLGDWAIDGTPSFGTTN